MHRFSLSLSLSLSLSISLSPSLLISLSLNPFLSVCLYFFFFFFFYFLPFFLCLFLSLAIFVSISDSFICYSCAFSLIQKLRISFSLVPLLFPDFFVDKSRVFALLVTWSDFKRQNIFHYLLSLSLSLSFSHSLFFSVCLSHPLSLYISLAFHKFLLPFLVTEKNLYFYFSHLLNVG